MPLLIGFDNESSDYRPNETDSQPPNSDKDNSDYHTIGANSDNDTCQSNNKYQWRKRWLRMAKEYFPSADAWIAVFTFVLAIETFFSIKILNKTDAALHASAKAASDANAINLIGIRPYMKVAADVSRDLEMGMPPHALPVTLSVENVGRSPAHDVYAAIWAYPLPFFTDVVAAQKTLCAPVGTARGPTIYPGETKRRIEEDSHIIPIVSDEIISDFAKRHALSELYVFGCVAYSFGKVAESGKTSFIFKLIRSPPGLVGANYIDRFDLDGGYAPRNELSWLAESVAPGQNY